MMSAEAFQSELAGDESLLWSGQPDRSVIFHTDDLFTIPFALTWGALVIYGQMSLLVADGHIRNPVPWPSVVWALPFQVLAQYLIWGRFIHVASKKSRTFYAVTSKRILLRSVGKWFGSQLKTLDLSAAGEIKMSIRSKGIGTLQFGESVPVSYKRRDDSLNLLERNGRAVFVDIADAEMVYHIIMEAKEKQDSSQTT